jgi:hypothetical protein
MTERAVEALHSTLARTCAPKLRHGNWLLLKVMSYIIKGFKNYCMNTLKVNIVKLQNTLVADCAQTLSRASGTLNCRMMLAQQRSITTKDFRRSKDQKFLPNQN